jgi:glycosyltransferase involved in cell wall biosynthesis
MELKRIIFVVDGMARGGAQNFIIGIAKRLNGYEKYLVILFDNSKEIEIPTGVFVRVERINTPKLQDPRAFIAFLKVIWKLGGDILFVHLYASGLWSSIASILCKTPIVYVEHNVYLARTRRQWQILRLLLGVSASRIIAVSSEVATNMNLNGIKRSLIQVIPNPAPKNKIHREKRGDVFNFVHLGRLAEHKQPQQAIASLDCALKLQPAANLQLHFYGDGPCMDTLKREVALRRLEGKVFFHGFISHDETMWLLGKMHCLLSFSQYEGSPLSRLESLAAGLCVITTRTGGVRDISEACGLGSNEGFFVLNESYKVEDVARNMLAITEVQFWTEECISRRQSITDCFSETSTLESYLREFGRLGA